jgi:peptide/nickel transport system substrate-binding protein
MLAAAGWRAQTGRVSQKPTRRGGGGPLKLLFWQGPTLLNPHFGTGAKDQEGAALFYEALARYDPDGNLVPVLAAEIPSRANGGIAADGRSTVWKLKKGVRWHDGRPFTADDVAFNFTYATDPTTAATTLAQYEGIAAATRIDAETLRFEFQKPTPLWHHAGTVALVPKHLFEAFDGARSRDAPANLRPVGTGPYRFVDFKPGDLLRRDQPRVPRAEPAALRQRRDEGWRRCDLGGTCRPADRRVRLRLESAGRRRGADANGSEPQGPRRRLSERRRRDDPVQPCRPVARGRR